ncbi:hypothetical protein TruAng_007190 [Truncatella angustata]|nr:hypothetical protein TruAng_007190 [Truncatella angustata]
MALAAYSPATYNDLPYLPVAGESFDKKNGYELVATFRELFLDHKVDRVFGLSLLHRHFDLDERERLVEYNGTAVPWNQDIKKFVQPNNWVFEGHIFRPFEFYYNGVEGATKDVVTPDTTKYQAFVESFKGLLVQYNAADLFGLCSYPGDDYPGRVEVTQARANINLHPKDVSSQSLVPYSAQKHHR